MGLYIAGLGSGILLGGLVIYALMWKLSKKARGEASEELEKAKQEAEGLKREAEVKIKDELFKRREELEEEFKASRQEVADQQKRITKREDNLDRKLALLDKKEELLERTEKAARKIETEAKEKLEHAEKLDLEQEKALERVSGLARDQARSEILDRVERSMDSEISELTERRIERARDEADEKANEIVLGAVQRCATDVTAEVVVSTIDLPSDGMKGRIIGREGRNIRAFEKATGIDVIVDDTPGVIILSGFDAVRREIARRSMEKLVADGRIHPARIEETVQKTEAELERVINETGKKVSSDLGIHRLHKREINMLGRLRYRTSYGQNVLQHSQEVALIAGELATELKLDEKLARRAGLLHDIGKAIDHEQEGTHPELGAEVAKRCDEEELIVNAIASHHSDIPPESLYSIIIQVADAISAARPGARRESLEKYIKRLERLEGIATAYDGIEKAFAIQAGREVRVIAKADSLDDGDCRRISREIAKQVEAELSYPGEVKINLIREQRFIEYAR